MVSYICSCLLHGQNDGSRTVRMTQQPYHSINDLTVISEDEYYFTNDSAFNHHQGGWRMIEMMIPLNLGSIGYCKNGNNCKLVTSQNLAFPNGITWKKMNGRMQIYVTLYKGTEILIYQPDNNMNLNLVR